jgi:hypothetical protein
MPNYKLSPSDFAFLWEECKRCFYLKHVTGFKRPGGPFPSIFGTIDLAMRDHYIDARTDLMSPALPPGTMTYGEKWVQSDVIALPGREATCYVRGKFDAAVAFDDGTYGLIDFKTSAIKPRSVRLYARQLRAYTYALEHPAPGKLSFGPISHIGLLAFTPDTYTTIAYDLDADPAPEIVRAMLGGQVQWYPIRHNEPSFLQFMDQVLALLDLPEPPPADPGCQWCKYRAESRANGL